MFVWVFFNLRRDVVLGRQAKFRNRDRQRQADRQEDSLTQSHKLIYACIHREREEESERGWGGGGGARERGFSFSFNSRWHCSARKGPYTLRPVSQQSPQGFP